MRKPTVDYRHFRLDKLNSREYRHLWLILFWPLYFLAFWFVEKIYRPAAYHVMHCAADDWIPFCEGFVIPYVLWYPALFFTSVYALFYNVDVFRRFTKYIALTFSISVLTYIVWPTCQNLRPETMPRNNFCTWLLGLLYAADPSRNVCPSMHVAGALGVLFASWRLERLQSACWRAFFWVLCVLISISTVFLKQHSLVDVAAAIPLSLIGYALLFHKKRA